MKKEDERLMIGYYHKLFIFLFVNKYSLQDRCIFKTVFTVIIREY